MNFKRLRPEKLRDKVFRYGSVQKVANVMDVVDTWRSFVLSAHLLDSYRFPDTSVEPLTRHVSTANRVPTRTRRTSIRTR